MCKTIGVKMIIKGNNKINNKCVKSVNSSDYSPLQIILQNFSNNSSADAETVSVKKCIPLITCISKAELNIPEDIFLMPDELIESYLCGNPITIYDPLNPKDKTIYQKKTFNDAINCANNKFLQKYQTEGSENEIQ